MNIFILDHDPAKAARMLCNVHVRKMIVESCQLLSTHDRLHNAFRDPNGLYQLTHVNHPCRKSLKNPHCRLWLIWHLQALLEEYKFRFGKYHKCQELFDRYWANDEAFRLISTAQYSAGFYLIIEDIALNQHFAKCVSEECKTGGHDMESIILSYRKYYTEVKKPMLQAKGLWHYTKREEPEIFK